MSEIEDIMVNLCYMNAVGKVFDKLAEIKDLQLHEVNILGETLMKAMDEWSKKTGRKLDYKD